MRSARHINAMSRLNTDEAEALCLRARTLRDMLKKHLVFFGLEQFHSDFWLMSREAVYQLIDDLEGY